MDGDSGEQNARPLRVLRVITRLPPGGIERRLLAMLPMLRDRGIEAEVAVIHKMGGLADDMRDAGFPVHWSPMATRLSPSGVWRLSRLMKDRKIDLVHSHMYRSNVPATVAAALAGVPIVAQVHNVDTWETLRQRTMDRFLSRRRARMLAVSERVAEDIERSLGLSRDKIVVLYNGVALEQFGDRAQRSATRASLGLGERDVAFICPARLHSQKNHLALIDAMAEVVANHNDSEGETPVLLLAGDGTYRDTILQRATDAGLMVCEGSATGSGPRVAFLGHRDDMAALYAASDAMILPSFKEGFSNAVVEAMASSLPLIVSDVGGNREAIGESDAGIVLSSSPEGSEIACAMRQLMGAPAERTRRGAVALERSKLFSLEAMADATAKLYRQVVAEHNGTAGRKA